MPNGLFLWKDERLFYRLSLYKNTKISLGKKLSHQSLFDVLGLPKSTQQSLQICNDRGCCHHNLPLHLIMSFQSSFSLPFVNRITEDR